MQEIVEKELLQPSTHLYEIKITETSDPVNTLKWIHEHPGIKSFTITDVGGTKHSYLYEIKTDKPRYASMVSSDYNLPEHIIPMYDNKLGRRVVAKASIKPIQSSWYKFADPSTEAHTAAVYEHPYIASVHDLASDSEGDLYIIMEYLPNGTLLEWIKRPKSISDVAKVVEKISTALYHIHTVKKLVYADMKPFNVAFDRDNNPKILDFELAQRLREDGTSQNIAGTYDYQSPEQSKMKPLTPLTDLYSFAATIFTILTMESYNLSATKDVRLEFERNNSSSIPFKKDYEKQLTKRQKDLLAKVLHKALNRSPQERQTSVLEFNKEFQAALKK